MQAVKELREMTQSIDRGKYYNRRLIANLDYLLDTQSVRSSAEPTIID